MIRRLLSPGVYLLSVPETQDAADALRKAGVDIVARYTGEDSDAAQGGASGGFYNSPYPALDNGALGSGAERLQGPTADDSGPRREEDGPVQDDDERAEADTLKEKFRSALEQMRLTKAERDELSARIERRLVLSESQLSGASIRYEKLEARGLDYVGKAAIAKQAIASRSLVEVTWSHPQNGVIQVLGIPQALEKTGGESILVLNPLQEDNALLPGRDGESIRIPLGKISLLRRIKKSIFGE
jgi:hypothetical protein